MEIYLSIIVFLFGTIMGSFLNVIIFRYNTGRKPTGRSFCFSCGKKLNWYELIPIISFLIQKGKCKKCKSRISVQYPVVEILTGVIFLLIFNSQFLIFNEISIFKTIFYWIIFSILIIISVYDIRHKIIPNRLVLFFIILSFISLFLNGRSELIDVLSGFIFATPFALIWLFSKGRMMGLGDAKLILGIGFLLGFSQGLVSLIISFWFGAIVGIGLILLNRTFTIKSEIPFGPFLILGAFIVFLWNIDLNILMQALLL